MQSQRWITPFLSRMWTTMSRPRTRSLTGTCPCQAKHSWSKAKKKLCLWSRASQSKSKSKYTSRTWPSMRCATGSSPLWAALSNLWTKERLSWYHHWGRRVIDPGSHKRRPHSNITRSLRNLKRMSSMSTRTKAREPPWLDPRTRTLSAPMELVL